MNAACFFNFYITSLVNFEIFEISRMSICLPLIKYMTTTYMYVGRRYPPGPTCIKLEAKALEERGHF